MRWYARIIAAHTAVTKQVSHLERMQSTRYFVWQEDGSNDLSADGGHAEHAVTGFTDLFTTVDFDPWADALGKSLTEFGVSWSLRDFQYEEDTGISHYTWDWTVPDGDEEPPAGLGTGEQSPPASREPLSKGALSAAAGTEGDGPDGQD